MLEFFKNIFASDFIPHGHCLLWDEGLVWLHVFSDSVITVAYYSIPLTLLYFVRKRQDLVFHWMFLMFAAFIFACGTTHLMALWTLWDPIYRFEGVIKLMTAGVSMVTAILLIPLVPRALALPSPAQLEASNWVLRNEILEREKAEEALRKARDELEIRVQERTAEISRANELLKKEITQRKQVEEALKESLDQLAKKNRYENIISTITQSVHQTINLEDVLENAAEEISKNIDSVHNIGIFLVEGEKAILKSYRGLPDWFVERIKRISYPKGFIWKTIIEGKSIYCADAENDTIIGPAGMELGTKSYLSMPLRYGGNTVGAIGINSLEKKNAFDEGELKLLEIIAQQIETAINNAKQAEAIRKAHDQLEIRVRERTAELQASNESLQTEIIDRKRAEEQVRTSLREKEVLLKEIHHRVKNNLQVISSLLNLQSRHAKNREIINILRESQDRIDSIALVHEKLYQSKEIAKIDFADYISNLTNSLLISYGVDSNDIILDLNIDNVAMGIDTAIPCGLIVSELISNSLRHAFPSGGKGQIRVELYSHDIDNYTLIVADNGVGLPHDLDFKNTDSLGLQLVCTLTNQLDGTIELARYEKAGAEFKILFSELKYKTRGEN